MEQWKNRGVLPSHLGVVRWRRDDLVQTSVKPRNSIGHVLKHEAGELQNCEGVHGFRNNGLLGNY